MASCKSQADSNLKCRNNILILTAFLWQYNGQSLFSLDSWMAKPGTRCYSKETLREKAVKRALLSSSSGSAN